MKKGIILLEGSTPALTFAGQFLQEDGYQITDQATLDVSYVLLDVPSFLANGKLRSGKELDTLLTALPKNAILCGGNLYNDRLEIFHTYDFLQDETYLCANAAITANCALRIATQHLSTTLKDAPTLIIGWGRIGKCLAQLLRSLGCNVSVAARNGKDRAILFSLGYDAVDVTGIIPEQYRLILNTAPEKVLDVGNCKKCVKIDLASQRGLIGEDIIWARGLPGMYAPESSGKLIAQTFQRLTQEEKS